VFHGFTYAILFVAAGSVYYAVRHASDTLHPLAFMMPAAAYLYGFIPLNSEPDVLFGYFTLQELEFVQGMNAASLAAFALGGVFGSRGLRRSGQKMDLHSYIATRAWRSHLRTMGWMLGGIALMLYAYGLFNVGGFVDAYDQAKGGGRAASGYLRDFTLLAIPAILLLFLGRNRNQPWTHWVGILFLSSPLLVHGLLSARRGPTFMGIATLVVGWYLSRGKRPSLPTLLTGGAGVALLLLILVTFRSQIYIGSSFLTDQGPSTSEVLSRTLTKGEEASSGNEFVYGSYVALQVRDEGDYFWGQRYLTYVFVRPIPGFVWPTKYEDVGMESLFVNAGTLGKNADPDAEVTYVDVPDGAAPGFIGDLFIEFSWGAVPACFVIGWLFALLWRRSVVRGGLWTIIHACTLILSLYFVTQTVEAFLFRFLVILVPTSLFWIARSRRFAPWHHPKARARVAVE
jgi:oligosaccharide repeat unit polymerase